MRGSGVSLLRGLFAKRFADPADELIGWLSDKSLDDRRIVAGLLYGGPFSMKAWEWLLCRKDCDIGTAAMLLWEFGLPYSLIKGPLHFPLEHEIQRQLINFIAERWARGQFADAVFEYDPRLQVKHYRQALARKGLKGQDPLQIPEAAWKPVPGRQPQGSSATAFKSSCGLDEIRGRVRLADLAAINPAD